MFCKFLDKLTGRDKLLAQEKAYVEEWTRNFIAMRDDSTKLSDLIDL